MIILVGNPSVPAAFPIVYRHIMLYPYFAHERIRMYVVSVLSVYVSIFIPVLMFVQLLVGKATVRLTSEILLRLSYHHWRCVYVGHDITVRLNYTLVLISHILQTYIFTNAVVLN